MVEKIKHNNWFDQAKVNLENLNLEQEFVKKSYSNTLGAVSGSGVLLDFPQEPVIFDTNSLSLAQQGYVAVSTFDGRGVLAEPIDTSDLNHGNQLTITVEGARVSNSIPLVLTIIGKLFDNTIVYEHIVFKRNSSQVTRNHFKQIINVLFQNCFGNNNTSVDGQGCYNTIGEISSAAEGRVVITEASSMKLSADLISAEQVSKPDIIFRGYKVYDAGKTLSEVLQEAIGASNDVDDLNINTTGTSTRLFEEGDSTERVYGQKFKLRGNNIQKITLLLGLESGSDWSGTLVVGLRKLQNSSTFTTEFLPDDEIDFDPDTVALDELAIDQDDLENMGISLSSTSKPVDFVFSGSQLSNPSLSNLEDESYYILTIRRTGSTSTGTIFLEEASNSNSEQRLTVFSGGVWTDVEDSSLWFKVWSDSVKVASGVSFNDGVYLPNVKITKDVDGTFKQNITGNVNFVDTSEGVDNYVIVENSVEYGDPIAHPRTGDEIFSTKSDVPEFKVLEKEDVLSRLITIPQTLILGKVQDSNPKGNPQISGKIQYPGLCLGNEIYITNPSSDLLLQNVVGSVITPDELNPSFKYRIVTQETITYNYGDVNADGEIDVFDAERVVELDGYSAYLSDTGTYLSLEQKSAVLNGSVSVLELIRADVNRGDGYEISSDDLDAINNFIDFGTAFPSGESEFTVVKLTVESILDPIDDYDSNGISLLKLEEDNPELIEPSNFSPSAWIDFSIEYIETWEDFNIEIVDLRRVANSTFIEFSSSDIQGSNENGGKNSFLIAGDMYLSDNVKNLDGTYHRLDFETSVIDIELPEGNTEGEINIFEEYVVDNMKFSDGTLVSSEAINNSQVKFEVFISSHVKNVSGEDGYIDFDGYSDGYGANADEAIATYLNHETGLLRIRAYNIVRNELFPELRSRISIKVSLKKAGFLNKRIAINSDTLQQKLNTYTP